MKSIIQRGGFLKQCRSYKSTHCKLLLVMTHSHAPPVCAESTAAFCGLYAFSSCVKIWKLYLSFGGGSLMETLIGCASQLKTFSAAT